MFCKNAAFRVVRYIMRFLTDRVGGQMQSRSVQLNKMPFWRMREIGFGVVRAMFWHRVASRKRFPVIHKDVKLRRWEWPNFDWSFVGDS